MLAGLMAIQAYAQQTDKQAQQQTDSIPFTNTLPVEAGDSPETLIAKAAHIVPTPNQWAALQDEFIAFVHFGPNTFTRREWGNGMEDPKVFDLKELDTDQWCAAMKAAGMKKVLITAKHHDGFVLWQSRYTRHGIMSTGFRDGQGDVLKELAASCRKYGLKLGVYLSPADLYQIEHPQGLYGNESRQTLRTIPREVPGRPFENPTRFQFEVDDYNEYFLNQLFELLTEYGPIHEVWFDGAHPKRKGGQTYNYLAWKKLIRTLAPEAVIFGREDVRWCGNEAGGTRDTEWNVIPYPEDPNQATQFPDLTSQDLGSRERLAEGRFLHYQQPETDTSIREGWFYRDDEHQRVRNADEVFDIYERSVGGNATFLLNIPPNREGRFSPTDVQVLEETGRRIRETYGTDLLQGASGPQEVLDGNLLTYLPVEESLVVELKQPVTLNRLLLQEAVSLQGERVESHAADVWTEEGWKEVARATNIGYKRILRFPEVTTKKIRIRILASRATPAICRLSAHYYPARPPQLACRRTTDGQMSIEPQQSGFRWKPNGHNAAGNLNAGFTIHYTTDGTEPDGNSACYTAPFFMGQGTLKAVALLNGRKGAVLNETVGLVKSGWKLLPAAGIAPDEAQAGKAWDEDTTTCWEGGAGELPAFCLDLGRVEKLNGFAYTPPQGGGKGLMNRGHILVSRDGKKWKQVAEFDFGNLVNDPTKRFLHFAKTVETRYVQIRATGTTTPDAPTAVAEIDLF